MAELPGSGKTRDERSQAYTDAIRRRVCSVCLDAQDDGRCGLTKRVCAIEKHLPRVVETVLSVDSDRMDEYVAAIRAQVCGRCPEQSPEGPCELRNRGDCALDMYLFLVVDAIQEVREAEGRPPGGVL